jgi:manganese/zinc/iron transport system substrate-binding protein
MKILAVLALAFAVSLIAACAPKEEADDGRLRIVATTGMVADLARVVGGEHVHVDALMGPGVDPHLYKATPSDLTKLRRARLILYNGKGLEGKMASVFGKLAKSRKVVAVTEEIEDAELLGDHEHWDPHVWFDVSLWSRGAIVVGAALAEVDAEHAEEYRAAALKYAIRLRALHESVATQIAAIPKNRRVLITSHDAFRYFGRAYGLEVRGLQGISTASSAGVKDVEQMVDLIVSRKIKAVFVESSVSPKAIEAVRESVQARGHDVVIGGELFSDAMGDHAPLDTYVGMIEHNVKTLVEALK